MCPNSKDIRVILGNSCTEKAALVPPCTPAEEEDRLTIDETRKAQEATQNRVGGLGDGSTSVAGTQSHESTRHVKL